MIGRDKTALFAPALVAALLLVQAGVGQTTEGHTIIGKVRTQSGRPIPNVLVQLEAGNGVLIAQTVTTNEGDYAFSGQEGGSFRLVVDDPDHEPFAERVELARTATTRPGETIRVDIVLTPNTKSAGSSAGTVFHQEVPEAALKAYQRGVKLLAEHKSDLGTAALKEALNIFPGYFDAHLAMGTELFRLHRYDDATRELELARTVNSKDSRLYKTFGLVLYEQKKYAIAARVLQEAARLNPSDAQAWLMCGAALIETGSLSEAETKIKTADNVAAHKLGIAHLHLARIYEKRGQPLRAADELEAYLRIQNKAENEAAIRDAIKKLRSN